MLFTVSLTKSNLSIYTLQRQISLPHTMTTSIHITAIDGMVSVNSLFTLAVFLGSLDPNDVPQNTLIGDPSSTCTPGPQTTEDLVTFHMYSFSSFLFSSLIALALKQAISISQNSQGPRYQQVAHVNKRVFRIGMLVSSAGSVCGCVFLMLAIINVVQIKLGTLACGSGYTFAAVVPLVILVPVALLIYVGIVLYAFTR